MGQSASFVQVTGIERNDHYRPARPWDMARMSKAENKLFKVWLMIPGSATPASCCANYPLYLRLRS